MNQYENITIEEIISKLDPDFTLESIRRQIDNGLDNTVYTNYLAKFIRMYKDISNEIGKSIDTNDIKAQLIDSILQLMMDKFKFDVDLDADKLAKACVTLYEFFVINLPDMLSYFFESYILENSEDVASRIVLQSNNVSLNSSKQMLHESPDEIIKIMSSMYDAVDAIANMEIDFIEFLNYIAKHDAVDSIAERMIMLLDGDVVSVPDDMYTIIMQPIIDDEDGCGVIINKVNNNLYERFVGNE